MPDEEKPKKTPGKRGAKGGGVAKRSGGKAGSKDGPVSGASKQGGGDPRWPCACPLHATMHVGGIVNGS